MGILKALQFMGYNFSLKYRNYYTLLLPKWLENVNQNSLLIFLLGSKPKHLETALTNLRQQYPNIIVNGHHGYFDKEDPSQNQEIINKINQTKPNILLVGMGMPIQ